MSYLQDSQASVGVDVKLSPGGPKEPLKVISYSQRDEDLGLSHLIADSRLILSDPTGKPTGIPTLLIALRGNGFSCGGLETFLTLGMQGLGGADRPREQAREVILLSEKTPVFGFFFTHPTRQQIGLLKM